MIEINKTKKRNADNSSEELKVKKFKAKDVKNKEKKFEKKPNFGKPARIEKANWSELKKQKKELKVKRKQLKAKGQYDIDIKAKKIYEELKMKSSTKSAKEKLCQELHALLLQSSDYSKLSQSHDRARIVQMMLKKAPLAIKTEIGEKVIPHITEIALSKYGKFVISRLMVYCGKDVREKAINAMFSNILKLTCNKFSNPLIDMIYLNHATPLQKDFMKQELYSDLYKKDKNKQVQSLKDTWNNAEMMKRGIMNSTKMNLTKLASKNLIDNSLVHAVLLEFIEEAEEQDRSEIIAAYTTHLAAIASTKPGSRAAVLCYIYSAAKERRAMLKSIKEHVEKLCLHEHGHVLMIEILNTTDDTLNIKKTLLAQIVKRIELIVGNEYGKRVVYFLMSPSKEFLHPSLLLQLDDDYKLGTQKKDTSIRRKELIEALEGDLCREIQKNANFWLQGGHLARVTFCILQNSSESGRNNAFDSLCEVICSCNWMVSETEPIANDETKKEESVDTGKIKKKKKNPIEVASKKEHVNMVKGIEHPGLHISLKKLAKLKNFAKFFTNHFNEEIVSASLLHVEQKFYLIFIS